MEPILLIADESELRKQYSFLKRLETKNYWARYRSPFLSLIGLSIVLAFLVFFTETLSLIGFKIALILMLSLGWLILLILCLRTLLQIHKQQKWIEEYIKALILSHTSYLVTFDSDGITYKSSEITLEHKWTFYKAFWVEHDSIFLFPLGSVYNATSLSEKEIGKENYTALVEIVKKKLPELEK
jgi:hypothetical protein